MIGLALALCVLTGCENGSQVDMKRLREDMLNASELPEMLCVTSDDDNAEKNLRAITDIDFSKVKEYFIEYSADGTAYEIAVIELKSQNDMNELTKSLKKHIESRTQQYRYYMPEQVPNAENARAVSRGSCAALIMCDDPAAVQTAFEKAF